MLSCKATKKIKSCVPKASLLATGIFLLATVCGLIYLVRSYWMPALSLPASTKMESSSVSSLEVEDQGDLQKKLDERNRVIQGIGYVEPGDSDEEETVSSEKTTSGLKDPFKLP